MRLRVNQEPDRPIDTAAPPQPGSRERPGSAGDTPRRIFILEDHALMREVIRDYLENVPGFLVCGEAGCAEEALERIEDAAPHLILVDTALPTTSGIDVVASVRERWGDLPCLMLSGHAQFTYVERALAAGARGYVLKGEPAELPRAIRRVLEGGEYLSRSLRALRDGGE
ncbi:MAG: response regulator [Gemmatimonadota bacterium]